MKRIIFFIFVSLCLSQAKAQILNAGFETQTDSGLVSNWGPQNITIPIGPNCTWLGYDSMYFASSDSHTGHYAFETRVATYCNDGYTVNITSRRFDADTFADQRLSFSERPTHFSFYYKLFPSSNDRASFDVSLQHANGSTIGKAGIKLTTTTNTWTLATVPVYYQNNDIPENIVVNFQLESDSVLHLGSRFLIDDISYDNATGISNATKNEKGISIYPNPVVDVLYVDLPEASAVTENNIRIINSLGAVVKEVSVQAQSNSFIINTELLQQGIYFIIISDGMNTYKGKFMR